MRRHQYFKPWWVLPFTDEGFALRSTRETCHRGGTLTRHGQGQFWDATDMASFISYEIRHALPHFIWNRTCPTPLHISLAKRSSISYERRYVLFCFRIIRHALLHFLWHMTCPAPHKLGHAQLHFIWKRICPVPLHMEEDMPCSSSYEIGHALRLDNM